MNKSLLKSIITEYGIKWVACRLLYSAKLKILKLYPSIERLFEKRVNIKRINIIDISINVIESFLRQLPNEKQTEIITTADKAIDGIITGFSSIDMDYGNPINWHINPLTGIESCNNSKWYMFSDIDTKRGDIKAIWEASRFGHFYFFIRAFIITKDIKYYNAFSQQLEQWLLCNSYSYGVNFKCGQECSIRMINVLVAYKIFFEYGVATESDTRNVINLIESSYKKVLSNFFYAKNCIKNNHTLSELCGMIIGAWCCEDEKRLKKAYRLFNSEIKNQFMPDGGYIQFSFNYQRLALQIVEFVIKISGKTGFSISDDSKKRIKNSALQMHQLLDDNGHMPNYGSNDGALIFPVTCCDYMDFRPIVNTIYSLVEGKRLFKSGYYDEETVWFGKDEATFIDVERCSSKFQYYGIYSLRHQKGFMMICLQDYKTRPSHMDQLHMDLWHNGVNIFCDSGTYSYASEFGQQLVLSEAHNTAKLLGTEQMKKQGAFLIYNWTKCKDIIHSNDSFSGTMISRNGYIHKRSIYKTKQGYTITDQVVSRFKFCEFYFHTPCEVRRTSDGLELYHDGIKMCTLLVDTKDVQIKKTFRSLYYLHKEEISCIVVKKVLEDNKCHLNSSINFVE